MTSFSSRPQLKVVGNFAVGYDNIDLAACAARGVRVVNTPDVLTRSTAELTLALLLAAARRVPEGEALCRVRIVHEVGARLLLGQELKGRTAVLVGPGRIGQETAACFAASASKSSLSPAKIREATIRSKLKKSPDSLPSSSAQRKNPPLAEPRAPCAASPRRHRSQHDSGPHCRRKSPDPGLRSRRIFAAGLDVFEHEPGFRRPAELPNAVLLPHVGSATQTGTRGHGRLAIRGVLGILSGKKVRNEVKYSRENNGMADKGRRIIILSDGTGETAAQMTKAAMVQFRNHAAYFARFKNIRNEAQIEAICDDAGASGDLIVYTLVSPQLQAFLVTKAREKNIPCVDLLGPLLAGIAGYFGYDPKGIAGLLHDVNESVLQTHRSDGIHDPA